MNEDPNKYVWIIKSIPGGVVQIVRGAFSTREQAEKAIPDYDRKYYGVDYLIVND